MTYRSAIRHLHSLKTFLALVKTVNKKKNSTLPRIKSSSENRMIYKPKTNLASSLIKALYARKLKMKSWKSTQTLQKTLMLAQIRVKQSLIKISLEAATKNLKKWAWVVFHQYLWKDLLSQVRKTFMTWIQSLMRKTWLLKEMSLKSRNRYIREFCWPRYHRLG